MLGLMKYGKNMAVWLGASALVLAAAMLVNMNSRIGNIEVALGGADRIECNRYRAIREVSPSVVRIIGGLGEGSGFAFDKGKIVTNYHVVQSEPSPKIVFANGSVETGKVVAVDPERDLAIIEIVTTIKPLSWYDQEYVAGAEVLAFGFPYGGYVDGEVTANLTTVSGFRYNRSTNVAYLQVNGGVIEGMSGGPLVDMCGGVVGVNVKGTDSAFGLAISARTVSEFFDEVDANPGDFVADIAVIDFLPDESPQETVKAYYNYIKGRNYKEAYYLLSPNFVGSVPFEEWVEGFYTQLDTTVESVQVDRYNKSRVRVDLTSTDLVDGEFVYQSFSGSWLVRRDAQGHLKLWESNIRETTNDE